MDAKGTDFYSVWTRKLGKRTREFFFGEFVRYVCLFGELLGSGSPRYLLHLTETEIVRWPCKNGMFTPQLGETLFP